MKSHARTHVRIQCKHIVGRYQRFVDRVQPLAAMTIKLAHEPVNIAERTRDLLRLIRRTRVNHNNPGRPLEGGECRLDVTALVECQNNWSNRHT